MRLERMPEGGLKLELNREEAGLFQNRVERAAYIDTPPDRQVNILRLAEKILAVLTPEKPGT